MSKSPGGLHARRRPRRGDEEEGWDWDIDQNDHGDSAENFWELLERDRRELRQQQRWQAQQRRRPRPASRRPREDDDAPRDFRRSGPRWRNDPIDVDFSYLDDDDLGLDTDDWNSVGGEPELDWLDWGGAQVLLPDEVGEFPLPTGVVHLIGGTIIGSNPRDTYPRLAQGLSQRGFLVVATCLPPVTEVLWDHYELAWRSAEDFREAWSNVEQYYGHRAASQLAVFGVGHSLGAKLQAIVCSDTEIFAEASPVPRVANVFLCYNNFGATQSVPLLRDIQWAAATNFWTTDVGDSSGSQRRDPGRRREEASQGEDTFEDTLTLEDVAADVRDVLWDVSRFVSRSVKRSPLRVVRKGAKVVERLAPKARALLSSAGEALSQVVSVEFQPNPQEMEALLNTTYAVPANLIVRFTDDPLDQSPRLRALLEEKFGVMESGTKKASFCQFQTIPGSHLTPASPFKGQLADRSQFEELEQVEGDAGAAENRRVDEPDEVDNMIDLVCSFLVDRAIWKRHEAEDSSKHGQGGEDGEVQDAKEPGAKEPEGDGEDKQQGRGLNDGESGLDIQKKGA